ncbi:unnamed protein product [Rhizoctonia solani]|nr:unnamed protein product [Rhizoctonia solani]
MNRTICGPPKYLAPEIIQDLAYSYKVDWWSFGILLYEMSTGITPFWAENQSDMYARVLQDELQFPEDEGMDQDTKNLIRGLLQRNPALRTCEPRLKKHPYFSVIDWQRVYYKQYVPPYTPLVDPSNTGNAQNIGDACLDMVPFMANEAVHADSDSGFSWTASNSGPPECPTVEENAEITDVFDGYSFEGHDSIIIDSDELEEGGGEIKDVEALDSEVRIGSTTTAEEMVPHQTHKLPEVEIPHAPMTKIKPIISFAKLKLPKLAASLASSTSHRVATARSKGNSWAVSGFYKALDLHKFPQDGAVQDIPSVEPRLANWIPTAPPRIGTEAKRKNTGVAALGRAFNIHPFDREYGNTINSTLYEQALTLEALNSLAEGRMPDIDKDLGEEIDSSQLNTPEQLASSMFERLIEHGCNNLTPDINSSGFSEYAVAEGGFGDIWIGKFHDGTKLAIKVLRFNSTTDDTTRKQLKRSMREIYNWSKLEHENVHKFLGVIMFRGRLGMVSRWMEHGNLRQYLSQNHNADRYQLCAQIAKGVAYLHGVDMIHGDLKACNVLVASDGTIRLTDFDYSIISNCSLAFSATTRVGGGTLRWMAPELLLNEDSPEKNKKTDIYSLGMTFLVSMARVSNQLRTERPPPGNLDQRPSIL